MNIKIYYDYASRANVESCFQRSMNQTHLQKNFIKLVKNSLKNVSATFPTVYEGIGIGIRPHVKLHNRSNHRNEATELKSII